MPASSVVTADNNKDGYFTTNSRNAYSVNNITAVPSPDGSTVFQFGGPDGDALNHLPITPGWNYMVQCPNQ